MTINEVNELRLFSFISKTKRGKIPLKVFTPKNINDINFTKGLVARYDFIRGMEGEFIVNLTELRGVSDLGDRIEVLPGTKWSDIIKYSPEVYGNLDFSVGGDVCFNEPVFGFNEFGEITNRVEVEALNENGVYTGKYRGGIIRKVIIRKETKKIIYMRNIYDLTNLNEIIDKLKFWFSLGIPPFRDIILFKEKDKIVFQVAFPESRRTLVQKYIDEFKEDIPYFEGLRIKHRYLYSGYSNLFDLEKVLPYLKDSEYWSIRVGRRKLYFFVLSNKPLALPIQLSQYCSFSQEYYGLDCIACGKCVEVCPHKDQVGMISYSPLGFYFLSNLGFEKEVANCHMCGKCDSVCPVKLDIVESLKKSSNINGDKELKFKIDLPLKKVIVITPISQNMIKRIIKSFIFLREKGYKVGILSLNLSTDKIVKGKLEDENILNKLTGIDEIITVTPEEFYYLSVIKARKIVEISYIEDYVVPEIKNLNTMKVHEPCFLSTKMEDIGIMVKECSHVFLDFINNEDNIKRIDAEITLCPFTAQRLGIRTPLDIVVELDDYENLAENALEIISKKIIESDKILSDASWYKDLAPEVYNKLIKDLFSSIISSIDEKSLISLYFYLSLNPLKDEISEAIKSILNEYLSK
jgi:ferredoxin